MAESKMIDRDHDLPGIGRLHPISHGSIGFFQWEGTLYKHLHLSRLDQFRHFGQDLGIRPGCQPHALDTEARRLLLRRLGQQRGDVPPARPEYIVGAVRHLATDKIEDSIYILDDVLKPLLARDKLVDT